MSAPEQGPARQRPRSVYHGAPEEELTEPLLPRWFVLVALASIPLG